jgi:ADP-heptose:LPS heptosyltransferase
MSSENKKPILWVGRAQMIGDQICALPIARHFKKLFPESHLIWPTANKVKQIAPIYYNCEWIDEIYITDGKEGVESKRDYEKMRSATYIMEINPQHPDNLYPRHFNIYSETWRMAGLDIRIWDNMTEEERRPQLKKYWEPVRKDFSKKIIGVFCQAGYSAQNARNPSLQYWESLLEPLIQQGFFIYQFGGEKDWQLYGGKNPSVLRLNGLPFFDQIKEALECDLVIGTDSGSALVLGAYSVPQISLITIHWGNENNPSALSVDNPNNHSFYSIGGCDNIPQQEVLDKILEKTKF